MSNNIDSILDEVNGFTEIPVKPKGGPKPLTYEEAKATRAKEREAQPDVVKDPTVVAHRRADAKFIGRCVSGAVIGAGSIAAMLTGLMDPRLATAVAGVALAFVTFWAGAWMQYRFFNGGGLLDG